MQSHKTSEHRITVWRSGNSNEPVSNSIAPHFPDAVQFPRYITLTPFITPRERYELNQLSKCFSSLMVM